MTSVGQVRGDDSGDMKEMRPLGGLGRCVMLRVTTLVQGFNELRL